MLVTTLRCNTEAGPNHARPSTISLPPHLLEGNLVKYGKIASMTEEQYDGLVYALEVPEARNFAVNGVLVHDSEAS